MGISKHLFSLIKILMNHKFKQLILGVFKYMYKNFTKITAKMKTLI